MTESEGPEMEISENETGNDTEEAGTVRLGPKTRLRRARSQEERAAIIEGLPYEVGFGKTPTGTRFKPGRSGNPRGRRKGCKNLATFLDEALQARTEVIEKGKRRKLPKGQVSMMQLANQASAGNLKATALVMEQQRKHDRLNTAEGEMPVFDGRDLATVERFAAFLRLAPARQPDLPVDNHENDDAEEDSKNHDE